MKILVINCGSSSLKYQLIDMENEEVLAKVSKAPIYPTKQQVRKSWKLRKRCRITR